jgi:hypothetical protein
VKNFKVDGTFNMHGGKEKRVKYFMWENLKERKGFQDLGMDEMIILKYF